MSTRREPVGDPFDDREPEHAVGPRVAARW